MELKRVLMRRRRRRPGLPAFPPPSLLAAALCVGFAVLLLRGCAMARGGKGAKPLSENGADEIPSPEAARAVISLFDDETGEVSLLPLETYLTGVVAAEMPASFHAEALKAQAVAARTFTLRRLKAAGGEPCGRGGADVCTDSGCCQAYRSEAALRKRWGEDAAYYGSRIKAAVEATAGEVITYGGKPIEALYHSNSGGQTEDAANVFSGGAPYLLSVSSPEGTESAHFRDSVSFSRERFANRLNDAFPGAKLRADRLEEQVRILSRYESGRVAAVRLGEREVTGRQLRSALDLSSANLQIAFSSGAVRIDTLGYGHGVGMSQYGADAMAAAGADYRDILQHYYTGVAIVDMGTLMGGA